MEKNAKLTEQKTNSAHLINGRPGSDKKDTCVDESQDSLVARLSAGNRQAAAEFVDLYYEQIYLFMRRLGHSCQVSEDLTQECFLQAWQHIGQLRSGKALNGWLYRIAANLSKQYWRRFKGDVSTDIEVIDLPHSNEDRDKVEYNEQLDRLINAVVKLPIKLKQVVVLHYMQHLTIAEAAEAANVSKGTFKSRLSRALKALRKQVM